MIAKGSALFAGRTAISETAAVTLRILRWIISNPAVVCFITQFIKGGADNGSTEGKSFQSKTQYTPFRCQQADNARNEYLLQLRRLQSASQGLQAVRIL